MLESLEKELKNLKKVAIAYSGGIDSAFLVFVANKILGKNNVLAIIVNGQMVPHQDYKEAIEFLEENHFNYKTIKYDCLTVPEFRENHKDRCYHCKKSIMSYIKEVANKNGFQVVCDGQNKDDAKEFRPGAKATQELEIVSPLEKSNITKVQIRQEARKLGISFWDKPSNSCLATRFPYNTEISNNDLKKVELAEQMIKSLNIPTARVRIHGDIARIEVNNKYFNQIITNTRSYC